MLIEPGSIYIHQDHDKPPAEWRKYRVVRIGFKMKCPETGKWYAGVMYEPAEYKSDKDFGNGEELYVRTQKEFAARFLPTNVPVTIHLNGDQVEVKSGMIGYDDVVKLVRPGVKNPPIHSVTWHYRGTNNHGSLSPKGKKVPTHPKLCITAVVTGNA